MTYSGSGCVAAFAGLGLPHETAFQRMLVHPIQEVVEGRPRGEPAMGTVSQMGWWGDSERRNRDGEHA